MQKNILNRYKDFTKLKIRKLIFNKPNSFRFFDKLQLKEYYISFTYFSMQGSRFTLFDDSSSKDQARRKRVIFFKWLLKNNLGIKKNSLIYKLLFSHL